MILRSETRQEKPHILVPPVINTLIPTSIVP
jgi:hypothetical protein